MVPEMCLMCKRLFCCNKCRRRHEQKTHNLVYECAICRGDPLIIDPEKSESSPLIDLLEHVRIKHMPLHCNKCDKMYNSPEDLKPDLGKCERKENNICSLTDPISEYNIQKRQIRLKHIQESPAITSTPTNPSTAEWGVFCHKSLTSSTLSGIHSPDSEANQSPPIQEHNEISSTNQMSPSESPREIKREDDNTSPHNSQVSNSSCHITSNSESTSTRKKRVTFADEVQQHKVPTAFAFIKPKRISTPINFKAKRCRNPRFQAILNNFESNNAKFRFRTPIQERPMKEPDETPPTTESQPIATGRIIDFKQEQSPTFENNNIPYEKTPPKILTQKENHFNKTPDEMYKTCIEEGTPKNIADVDISTEIVRAIKNSISHALVSSEEISTEINLKIIINKKTVSLKETKTMKDKHNTPERKINQSTTLWSRICDGIKWVVWGEDEIANNVPSSTTKRKRSDSMIHESPVSNKRYRFEGRINGRRPIDRILKEGVVLPERSHSTEGYFRVLRLSETPEKNDENSSPLNKSF